MNGKRQNSYSTLATTNDLCYFVIKWQMLFYFLNLFMCLHIIFSYIICGVFYILGLSITYSESLIFSTCQALFQKDEINKMGWKKKKHPPWSSIIIRYLLFSVVIWMFVFHQNSYIEILMCNMVVLGGGAFVITKVE